MNLHCRLVALAAVFTVAAIAADSDMLNLVLPDATFVIDINMASILASPVGKAMEQAVRQGISAQLQSEVAKAKPELQDKIDALGRLNWAADVQDILIAGGTGKGSPTSVDRAQFAGSGPHQGTRGLCRRCERL